MNITSEIRLKAVSLGFDLCGIARARHLSEYEEVFRKWCGEGMNSNMKWLCRDIPKRFNPSLLLPGVKSVIVTGLNYFTDEIQSERNVPVVARYALGTDYHDFITDRLKTLLGFIKDLDPSAEGSVFCDSSCIAEKAWAVEAGLGWQGKNSVLINEKTGSFLFLGIILVTTELEYDLPYTDGKCGECRICIERCPTGAINENRTIDTSKCISNLTIENREPIDKALCEKIDNRIFGCDICQEVCPLNKKAKTHNHPELKINDELRSLNLAGWQAMTEDDFRRIFKNSPVYRKGFERFRKNIDVLTGKESGLL